MVPRPLPFSIDERIISSLLHDVCKTGFYFLDIDSNGQVYNSEHPYVIDEAVQLGHGEKSIYLIAKHANQFDLTPNELHLIRWHMQGFDGSWRKNKEWVLRRCPGIYAFHTADQVASKLMDYRIRP